MTGFSDRPEHTIPETSHHPAADDALLWLKNFMVTHPHDYAVIKESLYSVALSGNDMANYCVGTIERLRAGEPVSDRYLLALTWVIRDLADGREL